ncbi:protein RodZ, contains Xre-like HTH and DUF4115 domains [Desulfacinum hydrothermale DSM 13146]|uniref:Protein RodZ, contains Xre-like HTH and DUF4115 domains n=1 Tax=Desulfacinum hydrothermale DSM 13146 TaxID=1121390 RepID=A0A1W1WXI8_9BACT|nr:helix-turn-helix domain-containing protein [Desulfacinum hydrothermale]SMC16354.1 protein RodZ, contains Xre-like HTH and DUF4115 domains [Desulfacinum hydrothermale DSM 13146]
MEAIREIGAFLEGERKRQQLTLEAVSRHTRISVKMLRAIEEGELGVIGTPLIIRGFLKTYCEALGIDPTPVLEEYAAEILQYDDERDRLRRFEGWMKAAPSRGRLLLGAILFLILAAVLAAGWALWWPGYQQKKTATVLENPAVPTTQDLPTELAAGGSEPKPQVPPQTEESPAVEQTGPHGPEQVPAGEERSIEVAVPKIEEQAPGEEPLPSGPVLKEEGKSVGAAREGTAVLSGGAVETSLDSQADSTPSPVESALGPAPRIRPEPPAQQAETTVAEGQKAPMPGHTVRIVAHEKSWVQVRVDGTDSESRLMKPGDEKSYSVEKSVHLWVGNAGGIRVYWDDKPLRPLGRGGEVVRVQLPDPRFMPES